MELHRNDPNFVLLLTHEEVNQLNAGAVFLSEAAPPIATAVGTIMGLVNFMDWVGGNNGVEISGSIGSTYLIVLPRGKGFWGSVFTTIGDLARIGLLATNPLAWIVIFVPNPFGGEPEVFCDETEIDDNNKFTLVGITDGKVAILSQKGYFVADGDNKLVYANRPNLDFAEKWSLIQHPDGMVSFQSWMGTYMCADRNRGHKRVTADRTSLGEWEKFRIHFLGSGVIALQESEGKFVSIS